MFLDTISSSQSRPVGHLRRHANGEWWLWLRLGGEERRVRVRGTGRCGGGTYSYSGDAGRRGHLAGLGLAWSCPSGLCPYWVVP
jgi:hypothetical protein